MQSVSLELESAKVLIFRVKQPLFYVNKRLNKCVLAMFRTVSGSLIHRFPIQQHAIFQQVAIRLWDKQLSDFSTFGEEKVPKKFEVNR